VGADADVVIFDPNRRMTLSTQALHQRVDYCLYEGWQLQGYPAMVLARGEILVRDNQFLGEPGRGRFVATTPR
jgi:dihydropyrimidinase